MGRQASATTDDSVAIGTARGGATSAGSVAVGEEQQRLELKL